MPRHLSRHPAPCQAPRPVGGMRFAIPPCAVRPPSRWRPLSSATGAAAAAGAGDFHGQAARRRYLPDMRSMDAIAVLFPELAGNPAVRLGEGLLRAPRRGRTPPPLLSAVPDGPGAPTPAQVLADRSWEDPA